MGPCEKWLKIGKKILKFFNCFFENFLLHRPEQFRKLNIQSKSRDLTLLTTIFLLHFCLLVLVDVYDNLIIPVRDN